MSDAKQDTLTLHCNEWTAQVAPAFGMNTCSLTCGGKELLRKAPSFEAYAQDPCVYGIPALLPANRTGNGTFSFMGRTYDLGINEPSRRNHLHGCLHRTPFTVTGQTGCAVTGEFRNDGEVFPFPFTVYARTELHRNGYRISYTFLNHGALALPLVFALHANFREPAFFSVPLGGRWETDGRFLPTGRLLPLTEREQAWRRGTAPDGPIGGFFRSAGQAARLDGFGWQVSASFNQWILWNLGGGHGFLSIEPQCGAVNALNSGEGLRILQPGETETFTAEIVRLTCGAEA